MRIRYGTVVAGALAALAAFPTLAGANKFIAAGWEFNENGPDLLLARADVMDETPIDGCVLYVCTKGRNGQKIDSKNVINDTNRWDYADLAPLVPKYRKLLAHKSFRHSFLDAYRAPKKRVAWTDDDAWARIAHNVRTIAKFAKACGFVGLRIDPEEYSRQNQYCRLDEDGMSYDELSVLARKRGRQIFSGVFEEFTDVRILGYFLLTAGDTYMADVDGRSLRDIMRSKGSDLWTPFLDGIFDVIAPAAVLIDGTEQGYSFRAPRMDFFRASNHIHKNLGGLLSPENRAKYRMQMQNSFGVYLDGYSFVKEGAPFGYYMEPIDGSRTRHLGINLKQAVTAADEYIWFWGEKSRWASVNGKPTWKDAIPGLHDTLLTIKSPAEMGRLIRQRMESGELVNVNTNTACLSADAAAVPKPYWTWQEDPKKRFRQGAFGSDLTQGHGDKYSLVAEGVGSGSIVYSVGKRQSGEIIGISFCSKGEHVGASIGWKKDGKWDWNMPRMLIPVSTETDAEGWARTDWSFVIPEGADGFGLMLSVSQCEGEKAWFDDIMAIPLTTNR